MKMQEEIEILQGAMRDIAYALIQDAENKDSQITQTSHIHLSTSTPIPQKYLYYKVSQIILNHLHA